MTVVAPDTLGQARERITPTLGPGLGLRRGGIERKMASAAALSPARSDREALPPSHHVDGDVIALRKVALQR